MAGKPSLTRGAPWCAPALVLCAIVSLSARGARAHESSWTSMRPSVFGAFQAVGWSLTGGVSWTPRLALNRWAGVRGSVGGMVLKGVSSTFVATEVEVRLSLTPLRQVELELGGGAQTWFQAHGGTAPVASMCAGWRLGPRPLAGIFAGYSLFLPPGNPTHQVRLGVTLTF